MRPSVYIPNISREAAGIIAACCDYRNLITGLTGKRPLNLVNPEANQN
ncbi:MAG: hypothetical protein PHO01_10305 [Desulfotomaculaceae bacterium]|nr:hypothetical protein [Desulfotomaculaceae bacterium]